MLDYVYEKKLYKHMIYNLLSGSEKYVNRIKMLIFKFRVL